MEVRDLTARFAAFAERARGLDEAALARRWAEEVEAAHGDVYGALYARRGGRGPLLAALPALLRLGEAAAGRAERVAAALEALQERVLAELGGTPPRIFCVLLVGDGREPGWIAAHRGRLTWFCAVEALPEDRTGLRALVAHELARLVHLSRALGCDNRGPGAAPDPEAAPLGLHVLGHGLGAEVAGRVVAGLPDTDRFWFGARPDAGAWLAGCRRAEAALAGRLREELRSASRWRGDAWQRWLGDTGDPPRAGRYLGWRAVAALAGDGALSRLAAWTPDEAVDAVAGVLGRLGVAARL